jgi:predicted CoA-binding protein
MSIDGQTDAAIRAILTETRRIAVIGASDKTWRPSFGVFGFLLNQGYEATPVNPLLAGRTIHGRTVVGSLAEAAPLEMVDIFRASANAGAAVDEAISIGARIVWMQLGVVDQAAAERARGAGLMVVMDRCPVIEFRRLNMTRSGSPHRA